jgi:ribosomal protein S18 acetylase RimI-like enzyme
MNAVVRRATAADAELLSALNADVQAIHAQALPFRFKAPGPETFPPSSAAALIANSNNLVFVAEIDGAAAGYAYAEVVRRAETLSAYAHELIYLHHISVRPQFRRRGAGQGLIEAVRAAGRELGIALLTLDVWSFNDGALEFFRRQGLAPYNTRLWSRQAGDISGSKD